MKGWITSGSERCPYFKGYQKNPARKIRCEGECPGRCIHMTFEDDEARAAYMRKYCRKGGAGCMIHDAKEERQ